MSYGQTDRGEGNSVEKRGLAALKKQRKKQYRIRLTRRRLNKGRGSGVETTKYIKYRCDKERKEPKGNIQLRGTKRNRGVWRTLEGIGDSGISTFLTNPVIVRLLCGGW